MTNRENLLKAYRFQKPEFIPISAGLPYLDWAEHGYDPEELEAIIMSHPVLFPNYKKGSIYANYECLPKTRPDLVKGNKYKDGWGCIWETVCTGMVGAVTHHPLADWSEFDNYIAPASAENDGLCDIDWNKIRLSTEQARASGSAVGFAIPHGHTFLRIQDIRGYENVIFDMVDKSANFLKLLGMIEQFNVELVNRYIELEPDIIMIPEDLGMQSTPMLSPEMFNEYFKPVYLSMTKPIKDAGIIVHEHSDGFILPLIDDLVDCGGDVINMQDLVNGIDNIAVQVKGRMAIDLDIDRQSVTVNGSAQDIDDLIHEEVSKLGSKEGGLSLTYQPWPPTPAKNMDAVFTAMEKYSTYYA
jgi:uroporphyrinogen decarboxylase